MDGGSVSSSVDECTHQLSVCTEHFTHDKDTVKEEQMEVACDQGDTGLHGSASDTCVDNEDDMEESKEDLHTYADSVCSSVSFLLADMIAQDTMVDGSALKKDCVQIQPSEEGPIDQEEAVHTLTSGLTASDVTELGGVHVIEDLCSGPPIKKECSDEPKAVEGASGMKSNPLTASKPAEPLLEDLALESGTPTGGPIQTSAHTGCSRPPLIEETPSGLGGHLDFEILRAQLLSGKSTDALQESNVCKVCGRSFGLQETLRLHQLLHRLDDMYSCVVCGRSLGTDCPSGQGQYPCSDCGKNLGHPKSLSRHQHAHKAGTMYVDS